MISNWPNRWFRKIVSTGQLSRRDLIQSTVATVLLSAMSQKASASALKRRVIVVGAGFSGLACSHELLAAGCDVTVLEARGRIGGRVHSVSDLVPGKIVEAGGEMLGSNHPTVMAYAEKFGLKLVDVPEYDNLEPQRVVLNGKLISAADLKAAESEIKKLISNFTDDARSVVPDQPWLTPDAKRLDRIATSDRIAMTEVSDLAKSIFGLRFANDNAVPLSKQSYLGNLAQIRGGGLERY
jgi:monoamine oxidase